MTAKLAELLNTLPRRTKRLIMVAADTVMLPLALWAAFALRYGDTTPPIKPFWWLFIAAPLLTVPILRFLGLYRAVVRYLGSQALLAMFKGVSLSAVLLTAVALMGDARGLPRTVPILYWLLTLVYVGSSRFLLRALIQSLLRRPLDKEPVIIYGAGAAGAQLVNALAQGADYAPVALVDDDPTLHGSMVHGLEVSGPEQLSKLIHRRQVRQVLLALPSASRERRRQILGQLESLPVHVKTVPGLCDIVSGHARLDEIRDIDIEDLLGRDPVAPDQALLDRCIRDKSVLVTGAGGSIGSELCRQILRQMPRRLVLYDLSEYNLYRIEQDLRQALDDAGQDIELIPLLGSVTNRRRLLQVMRYLEIDTVYHAAAYKHVPIVEHNTLEGVQNNVFGTAYAAQAAQEAGVDTFVLISTDKAVRPTNVMGASKRLAEQTLQGLAEAGGPTRFCMVRFGNVLGSSGSVVPLFRRQIQAGGPITVTHPDITRYFMTIEEAASLVIQAGSLGQGGDVFLLDMGEPVRITDLARRMIKLMGLQVRDEQRPEGDIAITYSGLRPGEKLYEELLIGDNASPTAHPMIWRAQENAMPWEALQPLLDELGLACAAFDVARVRSLLQRAIPEYVPDSGVRERVLVEATTNQEPDQGKVRWLAPRD